MTDEEIVRVLVREILICDDYIRKNSKQVEILSSKLLEANSSRIGLYYAIKKIFPNFVEFSNDENWPFEDRVDHIMKLNDPSRL